MFFKMTAKIPSGSVVALSGGSDSIFALEFMLEKYPNTRAIHINHSTKHSDSAEDFVRDYCNRRSVELFVVDIPKLTTSRNNEAIWSQMRRSIFYDFARRESCNIVTAHNLDDAVEWWMIRAMNVRPPSLIHPVSDYVIRPFLTLYKSEMRQYLLNKSVKWIEDPTNTDGKSNQRSVYREKFASDIESFTDISKRIRKIYRSGVYAGQFFSHE